MFFVFGGYYRALHLRKCNALLKFRARLTVFSQNVGVYPCGRPMEQEQVLPLHFQKMDRNQTTFEGCDAEIVSLNAYVF